MDFQIGCRSNRDNSASMAMSHTVNHIGNWHIVLNTLSGHTYQPLWLPETYYSFINPRHNIYRKLIMINKIFLCSNKIDVNLNNVYMDETSSLFVNPTKAPSQSHKPRFGLSCYRFAARSILSSIPYLSSLSCIRAIP